MVGSCSSIRALGSSLNEYRLRKLQELEAKAIELSAAKTLAYLSVHPYVAKLGCRLHVPLMKWLQQLLRTEDKASPDTSAEVVCKLDKEIAEGSMSAGMASDEVIARLCNFWNCVCSFGLVQGCGEDGKPKVRRIDNHSESCHNAAAGCRQKS